jgi:exodeoxyribonuclease VII small subunit
MSEQPDPTSYGEAVAELEAILREIEDAEVDVDVLAERVQRAAHLIDWCRTRILAAREAVEDATAELTEG